MYNNLTVLCIKYLNPTVYLGYQVSNYWCQLILLSTCASRKEENYCLIFINNQHPTALRMHLHHLP